MSVKNPVTYGDYYFSKQKEAATILAAESEKEFAEMSSRLIARLGMSEIIPEELAGLISDIEAPAGAFLGEVGGRFVSEVADGMVSKTTNPLMESIGYLSYMK